MDCIRYVSSFRAAFIAVVIFSALGCAAQSGPASLLVRDADFMLDGFKVKQVVENTDCYSLQMDYPLLGQGGIDRQIREWINAKYDEISAQLNAVCVRQKPKEPFKFWSGYDLYTTSRTASLVYKTWLYAGGDQYFDAVETVNYLWNSGNAIGYKDLFAQPQGVFKSISREVKGKLAPSLQSIWENHPEFNDGLEAAEHSFQNFAITEEGLMIYFPTRQIAPFYAGPQLVDVPLGSLVKFAPSNEIWK